MNRRKYDRCAFACMLSISTLGGGAARLPRRFGISNARFDRSLGYDGHWTGAALPPLAGGMTAVPASTTTFARRWFSNGSLRPQHAFVHMAAALRSAPETGSAGHHDLADFPGC